MFGNGQLFDDWFFESIGNKEYLEFTNQKKEEEDKKDYEEIVKYVSERSDIFSSPYSNEEINNFEMENNIKLPIQLRNYLTTISRNYYITKFNQNNKYNILLNKDNKLSSKCFLDKEIYSTNEIDDLDDEISTSISEGNGTMFLRDVGCGYTDFIVLNGKYTGTIWSEELCGDGAVRIINRTFYKYFIDNCVK